MKQLVTTAGIDQAIIPRPLRAAAPRKIEVVDCQKIDPTAGDTITEQLEKSSAINLIEYPRNDPGVAIRCFRPESSGIRKHSLTLVIDRPSGVTNLVALLTNYIKRSRVPSIILFFLLTLLLLPDSLCQAQEAGRSGQIQKPVEESINIRQDTQQQEEQWRNDKQKLLARYDQLKHEKKQVTERKHTLEEKVSHTKIRIATTQKQLDDIEQIQTSITPLIANLITELKQFVTSDLPFLTKERRERVDRLVRLQDRPDVAVSEKFRKVMEAMLIEVEYGNTIEVYQETIETGGRHTLVDIFRLGRLSLFYQSLDQKECGFYNVAESIWEPLPTSYNRTILSAMEIGAKQRPVELLTLPLGRMQL